MWEGWQELTYNTPIFIKIQIYKHDITRQVGLIV